MILLCWSSSHCHLCPGGLQAGLCSLASLLLLLWRKQKTHFRVEVSHYITQLDQADLYLQILFGGDIVYSSPVLFRGSLCSDLSRGMRGGLRLRWLCFALSSYSSGSIRWWDGTVEMKSLSVTAAHLTFNTIQLIVENAKNSFAVLLSM